MPRKDSKIIMAIYQVFFSRSFLEKSMLTIFLTLVSKIVLIRMKRAILLKGTQTDLRYLACIIMHFNISRPPDGKSRRM